MIFQIIGKDFNTDISMYVSMTLNNNKQEYTRNVSLLTLRASTRDRHSPFLQSFIHGLAFTITRSLDFKLLSLFVEFTKGFSLRSLKTSFAK